MSPAPGSSDGSSGRARSAAAAVLLLGIGVAIGSPSVALCGPALPFIVRAEIERRRRDRRRRSVATGLLAVTDRLLLAVRAGTGLAPALLGLGGDADDGRLPDPLPAVLDDVRRRRPLPEAARRLTAADDATVRLFGVTVRSVADAGGPAGPALLRLRHTLAGIVHDQQRRAAVSASGLASAGLLSVLPVVFGGTAALLDRDIARFYLWHRGGALCLGLALLLGYGGWAWMRRLVDDHPSRDRQHRRRRRRRSEEADRLDRLVATVDLIGVVIGAGGTVADAVEVVADHGPSPVTPAFRAVGHRQRSGRILVDAIAPLSDDLGPVFHPLVGALLVTVSGGAPVGSLLHRLGEDAETARLRAAEARAGTLSVRLLPPLVCCQLPALIAGAMIPVIVVAIGRLGS